MDHFGPSLRVKKKDLGPEGFSVGKNPFSVWNTLEKHHIWTFLLKTLNFSYLFSFLLTYCHLLTIFDKTPNPYYIEPFFYNTVKGKQVLFFQNIYTMLFMKQFIFQEFQILVLKNSSDCNQMNMLNFCLRVATYAFSIRGKFFRQVSGSERRFGAKITKTKNLRLIDWSFSGRFSYHGFTNFLWIYQKKRGGKSISNLN